MRNDYDTAAQRLQRLLGGEALFALRRRLRRRYERGGIDSEPFTLSGLAQSEREVLAGLLGLPHRRGGSLRVDPDAIDQALRRAGLAASLRDALERLDGAILDRAAERIALQRRYHGDFDWAGLRIGNGVVRNFDARPWRFCTHDFRVATLITNVTSRRLSPDESIEADWDATLAAAMRAHGHAIDEEAVADQLLDDLAT